MADEMQAETTEPKAPAQPDAPAPAVPEETPEAPREAPGPEIEEPASSEGAPLQASPAAVEAPAARSASDAVFKALSEQGSLTTAQMRSHYLRHFQDWLRRESLDPASMPEDAAARYLLERYPVRSSRSNVASHLARALELARELGFPFTRQDFTRAKAPEPQAPAAPAAPRSVKSNGVHRGQGAQAHAGADVRTKAPAQPRASAPDPVDELFTEEDRAFAPPPAPDTSGLFTHEPPSPPDFLPEPLPAAQGERREAAGAAPRRGRGRPPAPFRGRVRISKRVDGSEGLPIPVGTSMFIGEYSGSEVASAGSIGNFLASHIRRVYGPFRGGRPTVYYVDRLDQYGNPIPGATEQVPIMPDPELAGPAAPPPPVPLPAAGSALGASSLGDKFLDYMIQEQTRREEKAEKRLEELKGAAASKGVDPALMMLLAERVKPEPLDVKSLAQEFRKLNPAKRESPWDHYDFEDPWNPPPQAAWDARSRALAGSPSSVGSLGALELPAAPAPGPGLMDGVFAFMKEQSQMLRDLLVAQRPTKEDVTLRDLVELAKVMAPPPAPPAPTDPLREKMLEAALTRVLAPPEKPKTVVELMHELRELREASDLFAGREEPGVVDVIATAIEHAEDIGKAVAAVVGAAALRAPQLRPGGASAPQTQGAPQGAAPAPAPPAKPAVPKAPETAQKAFVLLAKVAEKEPSPEADQELANLLFAVLDAYSKAADPWPRAAQVLLDRFKKANTRADVHRLAEDFFLWGGAKRLASEKVVLRVTAVLADNYPLIYAEVTGGEEKHLQDEDGSEARLTGELGPAAPAVELEERGERSERPERPPGSQPFPPGLRVIEPEAAPGESA
jgi:hypothetical protein